jgi:glyoxylase-like metal-dependent hydrolase (beta-lactamase superfamily II)
LTARASHRHDEARDWTALAGGPERLIAEPVAPGVIRLAEAIVSPAERSFFHLVEGSRYDALIDGGWGFFHALDAFRAEPAKPLLGIATHSHFDHIGGLHLGDRRFGHRSEMKIFAVPEPMATQALPYLDGRSVLADGGTISADSIRQVPCPLDGFLVDGDLVDLGGRKLTVLHTPGHSPGSLSLLDDRGGLLFSADTVHDGWIWDDIPGADRAALALSHERLARSDFALACPGHGAILDRAAFAARIERYRRERLDSERATGVRSRARTHPHS